MNAVLQDVRYGLRMLARNPGFTVVAVLTLALGIGANTAIFSVVNTVLLKPTPYKDAGRLMTVWSQNLRKGVTADLVSAPDFADWRAQNLGGVHPTFRGLRNVARCLLVCEGRCRLDPQRA